MHLSPHRAVLLTQASPAPQRTHDPPELNVAHERILNRAAYRPLSGLLVAGYARICE